MESKQQSGLNATPIDNTDYDTDFVHRFRRLRIHIELGLVLYTETFVLPSRLHCDIYICAKPASPLDKNLFAPTTSDNKRDVGMPP